MCGDLSHTLLQNKVEFKEAFGLTNLPPLTHFSPFYSLSFYLAHFYSLLYSLKLTLPLEIF